jgi:hypothetical protein
MTPFERWAVWSTSVLTVLTGAIYGWMKYWVVTNDPFAVVNHPLQPFVLKAHIIVAPLLTFAIGLVATRHVWRHIRAGVRLGRRTGYTTALMLAPMILSGYLIQAVTGEGMLQAMAFSHIAFGVVYAIGLLVHRVMIRGTAGRRP